MNRSLDLDTIAPDDPVETSPVTPQIPKKKSVKKISKTPPVVSSGQEFRARISEILGHTKSPLSSFLAHPKVFSFEERDDEEEILLVLRPHWFTNVGWILIASLMVFVPIFTPILSVVKNLSGNHFFITVLFWYLITFIFAFEKFLSWYFNVFIITDERVVDIDFNNLLVKKFSETKINMIQDITSKVIGLFPTMFNYGIVLIQTAAEVPEIEFENVPNPEKVIKVLQQLRQEEELEAIQGRIR